MVDSRSVPVAEIRPSRFQAASQSRRLKSVESLADSIKSSGLINPIQVWDSPDGPELLCGQRRLEAHKLLGLEEIPAKVHGGISATEAAAIHWSDNKERENLGYYEQSLTVARILGWGDSEAEVDRKTFLRMSGLSQSQVKRLRRLWRLVPSVGEMVDSCDLTQQEGLEISRLPEDEQSRVAKEYMSLICADNPESPSRNITSLREMVAGRLPEKEAEPQSTKVLADEIGADGQPASPPSPGDRADPDPPREEERAPDAEALPEDDEPGGKPEKARRPGTETVEYGECHDRIRLVMNPKDWIVTIKVPRGSEDSKPTQDIKREFDKSDDDRGGLHLMLSYMDMAAKMARDKAGEATDG